jgi:putative ABC transport system permease protein
MHWKLKIREAFERAGVILSDDVIEELAEHAESLYASAQTAADDEGARDQVERQIAEWVRRAPDYRKRHTARPPAAPAVPSTGSVLSSFLSDLRYALQMLIRRPGAGLVGIVTIALAMAAVSLMVSVVWGVLLKPLPWPDAERLVRVYESRKGGSNTFGQFGAIVTNVTYNAWSEHPTTIDGLAAFEGGEETLTTEGLAERVEIGRVSPSLFGLLHATAMIGRTLLPQDAAKGAPPVVIVSYALWQERFGGRLDVIGRTLRLDDQPKTIVGVMAPQFAFPTRAARLWLPLAVPPLIEPGSDSGHIAMFSAVARLRPGVTAVQAAAEARARAEAAPKAGIVAAAVFGSDGPAEVTLVPVLEDATRDVRPALLVLLASVGLLLLAAAANVANIQLARTMSRRRELGIRVALGAGGARLLSHVTADTLVIALTGGMLGVAIAGSAHAVLPSLLPADFPRLDEITIDWRVVSAAIGISILAGLAAGALPAWHVRRLSLNQVLAEDAAPTGTGRRLPSGRVRGVVMAGQVAIATVLLVAAALLVRTFSTLLDADRGFEASHVMTAELPIPQRTTPARRHDILNTAVERLAGIPGVTAAGYTSILPLTGSEMINAFDLPAQSRGGAKRMVRCSFRVVSPGYMRALGMRVRQGRGFTAADGPTSQPVAIVNRAFARTYLDDHPLGKVLPAGGTKTAWQVVGVVDDIRSAYVREGGPEMFVPASQYEGVPGGNPMIAVRTAGDPNALAPVLRAIIREIDPRLALGSVMTMEDRLTEQLSRPRLYSWTLAGFAALALAIATVGLFGVISYSVTQRAPELAVRSALGASPAALLRMVLRQGLTMTVAGIAVGLFASFWMATSLEKFLYGVTGRDVATYVVVALGLSALSIAACVIPAARAATLDPLKVLRPH